MRVIVYHNPESKTGQQLPAILSAVDLEPPVEYHRTLGGLLDTLARPENYRSFLVIQAEDGQTLDGLISAAEWITDFQIILILPDQRADTISKGHLLLPRFVTFANAELSHVGGVLENLISLTLQKAGNN